MVDLENGRGDVCGTAREARGNFLVDTTIAIDTITSGNGLEAGVSILVVQEN